MERDNRPSVSTFFADADFTPNSVATLAEHAAHHARVKRLGVADRVQITNGRGSIANGTITTIGKSALEVSVDSVRMVPAPSPIHLRAPIADRDRMLWLAEKATELGIASWQSVQFKRSMSVSPRGEGPAFATKLHARMIAALEQSGGAWLPRLLEETTVASLAVSENELPIVLDAAGESMAAVAAALERRSAVILVGPEGGIEPDELRRLTDAGWRCVRLAANTLRFETAGIAAVAAIRATRHNEET